MTQAEKKRQARYRQRRRYGLCVLRIPAIEHKLANAMIAAGLLTEGQALCRGNVEHVAAELLDEWADAYSE
jgi:hypothetical protein